MILIIGERKTSLLPLAATDLSCWFHKLKKLFSDSVRDDGAPNPCLVVRPLGCPDGIRGLQLGEEKAPLIRVCRTPGSLKRRIHRIHGIYLRQSAGFLQILAWQIGRKRLTRRGKRSAFISREKPLDGPNLLHVQAPTGSTSGYFNDFRAVVGWQRQELVILVSALAHSLPKFCFVAAASLGFFCCAFKLLASP